NSGPGTSWYERLTPFSRESVNLVKMLYEDLASHAQIHGVLFQDDAYLTDKEDFHPAAISRYKEEMGSDMLSESSRQDPELEQNWARLKTEVLIDFTRELMASVRKFRPDAAFARNLYSVVINEPVSELWFAQNYPLFLENYDRVVIMAYPQMDRVSHPDKWLRNIVNRAKGYPRGLDKTIFKVQTYDWRKKEWIIGRDLLKELREILMSGGKHIAYYPDNFWLNQPPIDEIKLEMSTKIYPFLP
ncbi:MAG: poly-beta-1,6-N-acetyl-D-glucosamine N-deacetylase PgaB, partial [Candidatus Brocadiales bacterium]|nr:poly-beta-1,6-N-acetyl-D-glucosamine N-deacetylase PgaB [Candidatus Brocadiales bacterium]